VITGTDNIRNIISQMDGQVQDIVCATANITHAANQIDHAARNTSTALDGLAEDVETALKNVTKAHQRTDAIKHWSENMIRMTVVPGIRTNDTVMIELAQAKAAEIAKLFENALATGQLTQEELFDRNYRPVAGTNPVQYETAFWQFCDKSLPPIQEPALEDKRITACVTVDNNGYMPRHMNFRSQPQRPDDPEWNKTNSRYKMMFNDPVGLAAARNTKPFLLQTYRAPLGNNEFALVKDCSSPIYVNGRHWGALRVTYDLKQVIDD
jgi:methyl-accepting chemotaxis protein